MKGYFAALPTVLLLILGLSPVQKHLTVSAQFREDTDLCSTVHCPENYTCQQNQHKEGQALIATCVHRCNFTCPTVAYEVCGTDNETYLNPCLFTKKHCFTGQAVNVLHLGYCGINEDAPIIILSQASVCGDRILKLISNIQHVTERNEVYRNQKEPLTYKDLVDSYFPSCKRDGSFQKRQCFFDKACWCSQPDGSLIEGTFQQGTDLDCEACKVGNKTYMHEESFYVEEKCEYCTCKHQKVKCDKYFCNSSTVNNTEELERELKIIILKAIYIQIENDHDPEVNEERLGLIDLDTALKHRSSRLSRMFSHLDKNKDDKLTEEYEFRFLMEEIDHLFTSKPTFLRLFSIFDKDGDKFITEEEWLTGFDDLDPSSDEVPGSGESARKKRNLHKSAPEVMKAYIEKLHGEQQSMES